MALLPFMALSVDIGMPRLGASALGLLLGLEVFAGLLVDDSVGQPLPCHDHRS